MKKFTPFFVALMVTACIGLAMFALGANALLNPNSVAAASAPAPTSDQASQQQLQDLVTQYQQREQQYQAELESARQQLQQESMQIQQYQNLLEELQARGVLVIGRDGRIFIPGE